MGHTCRGSQLKIFKTTELFAGMRNLPRIKTSMPWGVNYQSKTTVNKETESLDYTVILGDRTFMTLILFVLRKKEVLGSQYTQPWMSIRVKVQEKKDLNAGV